VCYCAALPSLPTSTRVVILQHPRERDMPIGTARMARLCLPNAELHVGIDWSSHAPLAAALADPARPPILLYPGPGAADILTQPPHGPVTLVVIDGTWSQARTVVRDNPILHALPRYAFATPEPSRYRIRREPRPEYCSTIEAVMHVLGVLEGDPDRFRSMLAPLDAMVDAQLACQAQGPARTTTPRQRTRPARRDRLPSALRERFADLVCVVAEANAWPYARRSDDRDRSASDARWDDDLVHWVALRPATEERFDRVAAPASPLSPSTPFHTRLGELELRAAEPRARLLEAFTQFVRPTDIIAAWGTHAPELFVRAGGALPTEWIDLRALAQRLENRRIGGLEAYAASLGATPQPLAARARDRAACLAAVVATWRSW
jgi:DTW domain-containing protein